MYCVSHAARVQFRALTLVPSTMSVLMITWTCALYALRNDTRCGHNLPGLLQVYPFRVLQAVRAHVYNCTHKTLSLHDLLDMGGFPLDAAQWPLDTEVSSDLYHFPSYTDKASPQMPKLST